MIKTRTMYDLYMMYLSLNIKNIQEKINNQRLLVDKHLKQVSDIKIHIQSYMDYNALINGKIESIPEEYKFAISNYVYFNIIIKNYYALYKGLIDYENQLKEFEVQKISYNVYKAVITKYNKKVLEYCLETGKAFENKYFGNIQAFYRNAEGVSKKINWKLSNENKKAILEKGGEPYLEKTAKEYAEKDKKNKGEKWVVFGFKQGLLYWRLYA